MSVSAGDSDNKEISVVCPDGGKLGINITVNVKVNDAGGTASANGIEIVTSAPGAGGVDKATENAGNASSEGCTKSADAGSTAEIKENSNPDSKQDDPEKAGTESGSGQDSSEEAISDEAEVKERKKRDLIATVTVLLLLAVLVFASVRFRMWRAYSYVPDQGTAAAADQSVTAGEEVSEMPAAPEEEPEKEIYTVTDDGLILFGTYEQDGDTSDGAEPIEWIVLDDTEDGLLLISRYVLDCIPYHDGFDEMTWETSSLRKWLNNDFYKSAFDHDQMEAVNSVFLMNTDNEFWKSGGGNVTRDRIFCLSYSDILDYFTFDTYYEEDMQGFSEELMAEPTQYAIDRFVYSYEVTQDDYDKWLSIQGYDPDCIGRVTCWWWLRSPGYDSYSASAVQNLGGAGAMYNSFAGNDTIGVRPALYLRK